LQPYLNRGQQGSLGIGGAMRVAPIGGYFADELAAVVSEARASAEVTHAHPDGIAGAIAMAVAAALAWRGRANGHTAEGFLDHVIELTPDGPTRARLVCARKLPADANADQAAHELGNGCPITSAETVLFTIWCACRHLNNFTQAMWTAASVGGDRDTICAIVGGIVALGSDPDSIPAEWLKAREALTV
jgi:ADP-ribosylglycohydrolase